MAICWAVAETCPLELEICSIVTTTCSVAERCCWVVSRTRAVASATSPSRLRPSCICRALRSMLATVALDSVWAPSITLAMSAADALERSARRRTSSATTANPRPPSPALAASMAALRARRFVWSAISLMRAMVTPTSPTRSARARVRSPEARMSNSACSRLWRVVSAWMATWSTVSAIEAAALASSSIVADVWATPLDCSAVVAASRWTTAESWSALLRMSTPAAWKGRAMSRSTRRMSRTASATAARVTATGTRTAGTAPAVARWLAPTTERATTNTPTSSARYPFTDMRTSSSPLGPSPTCAIGCRRGRLSGRGR